MPQYHVSKRIGTICSSTLEVMNIILGSVRFQPFNYFLVVLRRFPFRESFPIRPPRRWKLFRSSSRSKVPCTAVADDWIAKNIKAAKTTFNEGQTVREEYGKRIRNEKNKKNKKKQKLCNNCSAKNTSENKVIQMPLTITETKTHGTQLFFLHTSRFVLLPI